MLEHGGGILRAAAQYGIPVADWLDLSTGLNPQGWPVPACSPRSWQRLPEQDDGLEQAATEYYGSPLLLPVAGSQPAIQLLPTLRPPCRVGMLPLCYAEHPWHWEQHGHRLSRHAPDDIDAVIDELDVLLLCHPNNPTGTTFSREQLQDWRARLASRGGWLILDEAFMDATPEHSLLDEVGLPGLIVLRSVGKFFGLAGARVGFVFAWPALLQQLAEAIGPWSINGPAREVVKLALQDSNWQQAMRGQLAADSQRLQQLLQNHGLTPAGGSCLFQWLQGVHCPALFDFLASKGILVRQFADGPSLRFGLPPDEAGWQRLAAALAQWEKP